MYQIKKSEKRKEKNKSVDALIVHVVRFSRFDFKFLTALQSSGQAALDDVSRGLWEKT